MALYAIGDLHLSLGADKPMDVFGSGWEHHVDKLRAGLSVITPQDTTVLVGDLSWAMNLTQAEQDFAFINAIPGRKLLVKGNHDYWWTTAAQFARFCESKGFSQLSLLNNNCYFYGQTALCGTRGWFYEQEQAGSHDEKVYLRELCRLEASLQAAGEREKFCFLHYPPVYTGYECEGILQLFEKYGVTRCIYGHLHGKSHRLAQRGERNGVAYELVAADYTEFHPVLLIP